LVSNRGVQALYISGNPVGQAVNTPRGSYIHTLELRHTDTGDDAVTALAALPRLHCIDLPWTRITAEGISRFVRTAPNLQSLALDATQVTRDSVAALATARRILEIWLYGRYVTNDTVAMMSTVPMRDLRLVETGVNDDAVPVLAAMPQAEDVVCRGRHVLGAWVGELAFAAPRHRPSVVDLLADRREEIDARQFVQSSYKVTCARQRCC
jgi:hypothetical protein